MVEYLIALYLTASTCAGTPGCVVIKPGDGWASRTPTQRPNWCVVNKGPFASGAMLTFPTPLTPKVLMGPGIQPCGIPRGRIEPGPTS